MWIIAKMPGYTNYLIITDHCGHVPGYVGRYQTFAIKLKVTSEVMLLHVSGVSRMTTVTVCVSMSCLAFSHLSLSFHYAPPQTIVMKYMYVPFINTFSIPCCHSFLKDHSNIYYLSIGYYPSFLKDHLNNSITGK